MKKRLIVGVILLTQCLLATQTPVQSVDMPTKEMISQNQKIVKLAAEEMNKTLPQIIDKYTTLIQIAAKGTTLEYLFEINTGAKSDESVRKEDHARMGKAITEGVCHSSKRFLDAEINIRYIYRSAVSKAELFKFDINKKSCTNFAPVH